MMQVYGAECIRAPLIGRRPAERCLPTTGYAGLLGITHIRAVEDAANHDNTNYSAWFRPQSCLPPPDGHRPGGRRAVTIADYPM